MSIDNVEVKTCKTCGVEKRRCDFSLTNLSCYKCVYRKAKRDKKLNEVILYLEKRFPQPELPQEPIRGHKSCKVCREEKDSSEFYIKRFTCKTCIASSSKDKYKKKRDLIKYLTPPKPPPPTSKVCRICLVEKEINCFSGGNARCKKCIYITYHKPKEKEKQRIASALKASETHRKCVLCLEAKSIEEFIKLSRKCISCKEKEKIERRERTRRICKEYRAKNKVRRREALREYRKKNKERDKEKRRKKWAEDPALRIKELTRRRILMALKKKYLTKGSRSAALLGAPIEEVMIYLESQFKPKMSWENHGFGPDKWHLDHCCPLSFFDLSIRENQYKVFNYRNLQPLWAFENLSKGDKLPPNFDEKMAELNAIEIPEENSFDFFPKGDLIAPT